MRKPVQRQHFVKALSAAAKRGVLISGWLRVPCALGRSGQTVRKREGDGATPIGRHRIEKVFYRADRIRRPVTLLPVTAIKSDYGWCDAPRDRNYNRLVRHPYPASAERMWRKDQLYDVVVVLGYNRRPRVSGLGSAIFLHLAREGFKPTEGCVAVPKRFAARVLTRLRAGDHLTIER